VGDRIKMTKIDIIYKAVGAAGGVLFSAADEYNCMRVVVFRWWLDTAVSTPTLAYLFNLGAGSDYVTAPFNKENVGDIFTVLSDDIFTVYNTPAYDGTNVKVYPGPGHVKMRKFSCPIKGDSHVNFDSAGTTGDGHVYVMCTSDSAFTPHPTLTFQSDIEFVDA